jgi:hypothetical protein
MNLKGITGIGATERKPALHGANIALLSAPRIAFLGLLRANVFGLASVMNLKSARSWSGGRNLFMEELKRKWYNLGGTNWDSLEKAWQAGSKKKALAVKLIGKLPKNLLGKYLAALKDAQQYYRSKGIDIAPKGIGAVDPATITAISTALAIISQLLPLVTGNTPPLSQSEQENVLKSYDTSIDEVEEEAEKKGKIMDWDFVKNNQMIKLAALAAIAAYFLFKKKK